MNDKNQKKDNFEYLEKFQNLLKKIKLLEKEKTFLIRELEKKKEERKKLSEILEKEKKLNEKTVENIDQYIKQGKILLDEIQKVIYQLKKVQKEQEEILNSISLDPFLNLNENGINKEDKKELLFIVQELQKEIQNFKEKRLEIQKKIAQLKDL